MPLKMKKTVQQMVDEASAEIETVPVADAIKLVGQPGVTFIDIRDPRELWRDGSIPGAINVTRGMLEMWIDPESPYHKDVFASGKEFVFYCNGAWRSALACDVAQQMGLEPVVERGRHVRLQGPKLRLQRRAGIRGDQGRPGIQLDCRLGCREHTRDQVTHLGGRVRGAGLA